VTRSFSRWLEANEARRDETVDVRSLIYFVRNQPLGDGPYERGWRSGLDMLWGRLDLEERRGG
jgi:hypothetical protein